MVTAFCYLRTSLSYLQRERVHQVAPPYFYSSSDRTNQTLSTARQSLLRSMTNYSVPVLLLLLCDDTVSTAADLEHFLIFSVAFLANFTILLPIYSCTTFL